MKKHLYISSLFLFLIYPTAAVKAVVEPTHNIISVKNTVKQDTLTKNEYAVKAAKCLKTAKKVVRWGLYFLWLFYITFIFKVR